MAAKRFAMRLKQLREAKGWSQARLADQAGAGNGHLSLGVIIVLAAGASLER